MKQSIIKKLMISLFLTLVLSICVFGILIHYNRKVTDETATELGAVYTAEMMLHMQDHFSTIIDVKSKEAEHIANWTKKDDNYRQTLRSAAQSMDFDYVTLYDAEGNQESVLGESAWYRDKEEYAERILSGERAVTTGYLTQTGEKYIVFGTPAEFEMQSGKKSNVMLVGFSVKKLYEYINLDTVETLGSKVNVWIILTNGSYILKAKPIEEESLFDRLNNWGSFIGIEKEAAIAQIEKSMASGKDYSYMVSIDGSTKHIYGSPAGEPDNWYFMITMPQGISDVAVKEQNTAITTAYAIAGFVILLMICVVFLVYINITLQQRNELEIAWKDAESLRSIAENANSAKSLFLSNMSHDIRTPMNEIIGFTNLAIKEKEPGIVNGYLKKISVASNHLLLLINEILEMSRIESGKIVLDDTPCNLSDLLENLQTVLGKKAEEKSQKLMIHGNIQDNYVYGDKRRLSQILINLTDNAIKYTMEYGEITVMLHQRPCDKEGYGAFEISVADNGIGMSEAFVEKIFDPFERESTSTVSGIEGTGLGLSIVKHFVDMMEGTIEISTKQGEGSVFKVTVPLRIVEDKSINRMQQLQADGEREDVFDEEMLFSKFVGQRVLLVEDNVFNREIAQCILEQAGFIVELAENGKVALQKVSDVEPDYYNVILMDIQMPVMNGYEATGAIRKLDSERAKVRIIAVTANAFESDRENVLAAGMDDYITKPIEADKLYKVLLQYNEC